MAPDPDFDHEVREDAPFLASTSDNPGGPQPETKPRGDTARDASVIGFRLKVTLFAMVLAVEIGFAFLEGPMVRIMEAIACRQFYSQTDPTKIGADGQVPEEMCKVAEVQAELAAVKGYHMFFDGLLCALLAFPYGLLADRQGRKSTLLLGIPGFALNSIITVVVLWFSDIFPLRAVWFSALGWLLGGGPVVALAIIWTMMADVTTESERATLFFQFAIVSMGAEFITSGLSSWLMVLNPWIPLMIGFAIVFSGFLFIVLLPETKHALPARQPESSNVEMSEMSKGTEGKNHSDRSHGIEPYHDESDFGLDLDDAAHLSWSYPQKHNLWARCRAHYRFYVKPYLFILNRKPVILLLTAFLVYRLSRGSSWFLTQYISTRYQWTLAESNFLVACRPIVSVPLFIFGLPFIKSRLLSPRRSATDKDLWLARASIVCLTLGTLGISLSPSIMALIPSMVVQATGSGFVFLTRSIITTLVERDETARLFTVIEIIQSVGNILASLSITTVFQLGLHMGGAWIGLAWMMTSSLFAMVGLAIWWFQLPLVSKQPEFVVGEFDEGEA